jgi:signal transduction histidine kinase
MSSFGPPITGFESARLRIAQLKLADARELAVAIERAVAISAQSLGVRRVGVFMLSENRRALDALHTVGAPVTEGQRLPLPLADWPAYAAAIDERRVIAADDALEDPRTRELADSYLVAHGITSMLDVPIFIGGELWGILCHEHQGPQRTWTEREIDFAISVADMISTLFEQASRLALEKELHVRDVTSTKQRKNAALVQLGAGVAHDFNTVLQTIMLLAETAARTGAADARESLDLIREECGRGSRIVRQLLDFARATPRSMVPVDLAAVVTSMRGSMDALVGEKVQLDVHASDAAVIEGDRAQLEQIVMNLVVNARDAMPNGGTMRVAVTEDAGEARLSVSDEGEGIAEDVRDHIFEPFFTTKGEEGGTGLGLATVAVIAEQHGGSVSVEPAPGGGTTISVHVPRRREGVV